MGEQPGRRWACTRGSRSGPLIGGVLLATIGASWVFGLNALSFLVSVVLTFTVRGAYQEARHEDHDEHRGLGRASRCCGATGCCGA